jgi:hypothetical protein
LGAALFAWPLVPEMCLRPQSLIRFKHVQTRCVEAGEKEEG